MRLMFVYWQIENAGSAQTILHYTKIAKTLGHEVVLYAPEDSRSRFNCSLDIDSTDAVIFVLEWNLCLHPGGYLNLVRLVSRVPRERRIIIDNDGIYNEIIRVSGDYNHPDPAASRRKIELYDSLADKIYQPTFHPLRSNVRTFFFHGYDRAWEAPLDFSDKEYGMIYVGSSWFRWRALQRVLRAVEPIRAQVGRIGLVGHDWGAMPHWVQPPLLEDAYFTDPAYLRKLGVELMPPVPIDQVIRYMSMSKFNPVLVRPLFNYLRLVNPRLFETPAANTIPLFGLDKEYVNEIYGEQAAELVLADNASEQIVDVLRRPDHYTQIVKGVRQHLAKKHSYAVRFQELIDIIN